MEGGIKKNNLINMMELENILSYYGGFLDGEGYIGIKKKKYKNNKFDPSYSERVSVAGINKLSICGFNDLMVGNILEHKPSKLGNVPCWSWEVTNNKAKNFLKMIRPYLKLKGLDADLVLALSKNKEKTNRRRVPKEDRDLRENLYIILKTLHTRKKI